LEEIETHEIMVSRMFADFNDYWTTSLMGALFASIVSAMPPADAERLKTRVQTHLPPDAAGRVTHNARANAIMGRKPK